MQKENDKQDYLSHPVILSKIEIYLTGILYSDLLFIKLLLAGAGGFEPPNAGSKNP